MRKLIPVMPLLVVLFLFPLSGCGRGLKQENEQLKAQISSLQKENVDLKGQLAQLKADYEALKKELEAAKKEAEELNEKLKEAKARVSTRGAKPMGK
ncbi:MAG: hypothetical protein ACK4Z6_04195 [Candidatus Methylomirabilales bacterium]